MKMLFLNDPLKIQQVHFILFKELHINRY